jgi:hypothetical protein
MKKGSKHSEETRLKMRTTKRLRLVANDNRCKRNHEFTPENTGQSSSGGKYCRKCYTINMREWRRRGFYDCPPERYEQCFKDQDGLCILPSCGQPIGATDHSHATGKFRGLMCRSHNLAIGLFSDSPALLREAATYLEKFNEQQQLHGTDVSRPSPDNG